MEANALPHLKPEDGKNPEERVRMAMEEVSAPLDPQRLDLYQMIARLPEEQVDTARRFLRFLIIDANRSTATEYDEESLTEEDLQAISQAKAAIARGEFTTLDELERRLNAAERKHG
jgi:hypothetical protein